MKSPIGEAWRDFELMAAASREYPLFYRVTGLGPTPRNPILDEILPTLLFVRAMSLLDHALIHLVNEHTAKSEVGPKKNNLASRIDWAAETYPALNALLLHEGRDRRNEIAHEPTGKLDWKEFDERITLIHSTLQSLKAIGPRNSYKCKATRQPIDKVEKPDVLFQFEYEFEVEENGKRALTIRWTEEILKDE